MKTATILAAIDNLQAARSALMQGNLDVSAQVRLGGECSMSAILLRMELEQDCPTVPVKEAA